MTNEILQILAEAPGRELYITIRHGAYIRDATHTIIAGPFEEDEYQPLIDSGQLEESITFCSSFVLPAGLTPPDYSDRDFSNFPKTEDMTNG